MLLALLSLAGCYGYPATRENSAQYHVGVTERQYTVAFLPQGANPSPGGRTALAELRRVLRANTSAVLVADAALANARAALVSRALGRPVAVDTRTPAWLRRDEALLILREPAVVADACAGPGQPVGRNLWTLDDYGRQRLLPAGCATAAMLLEQAANKQDVLRGQPLEPGAAGPMARAADLYLRRNEERPARVEGPPGAGASSEERDPGSTQSPASSAGPDAQLPVSPAAPQQGRLPPASTPVTPR